MKHWEFLLQKEGDRSWLPLDSPDVEILEGRYRVVARCSYPNTQLQIRVTQLATDENPPKRRIQKRSGQTNGNGLLVVMPFTHLQPGIWELSCASVDLMSDLAGDAWNYTVKLQVSAKDLEEEHWEPTWTPSQPEGVPAETIVTPVSATPTPASPPPPDSSSLPPEVAEILGASMDRLFQIADQMSTQLIDDVLRDFDLNAAEVDRQTTTTTEPANLPAGAAATPLAGEVGKGYPLPAGYLPVLKLDQEALIGNQGETLILSGRLELEPLPEPATIADPWENPIESTMAGTIAQELQLCLRDPQSLQILISDRQEFSNPTTPCVFYFAFSLPDHLDTHLLLGEVLLCGTLPHQPNTLATLTTQSFTVTADPRQLAGELEKLSETLEETLETEAKGDRLHLPLELSVPGTKEPTPPSLELSFLEPEPQPEVAVPEPALQRLPSPEGPLPPQIYRPDPEQARRMSIQLPDLAAGDRDGALFAPVHVPPEEPASESVAADTVADEQTSVEGAIEMGSNPVDAGTISPSATNGDVREAEQVMLMMGAETEIDPQPHLDADVSDTSPAEDETADERAAINLPSPIQMAFQSLRLQDRFLHRLNSLATDAELSSWLRSNLYPGQALKQEAAPTSPSVKRVAEEIVVDDEPPESVPSRSRNGAKSSLKTEVASEPNPLILAAEEPVPTPVIEIPTGELTAGKLITIRARLPYLQPRIYVKLWIIDRQNRSILDGTRWLLDFYPNSRGELEATTQLNVPFGSLEVRFEAIAVEMHTQRESHKVVIDRSVVPPDLPVVSLDDFAL